MAEKVGEIQCTHKNCDQVATIFQDNRKKYYLDCPVHGRMTYNRNTAQAELKKLMEQGEASQELKGVVLGIPPESIEDQEQASDKVEVKILTSTEPENEKSQNGTVPLIFGALLGLGSWLLLNRKRKRNTAQTRSTPPPIV